MLGYACGDGLPSRTLKLHFKTYIGVDVSDGMLARFSETATRLGLGLTAMNAVRRNLLADPVESTNPPIPEDLLQDFDPVAICKALHHVEDVQLAFLKLVQRLRSGGPLLVIDRARMDGATPARKEFIEDGDNWKDFSCRRTKTDMAITRTTMIRQSSIDMSI